MSRISRSVAVILAALIMVPCATNAEPSALVNKLMSTQVSLFSYGLDRMRLRASDFAKQRDFFATVSYGWDDNQLKVNLVSLKKSCETYRECESVARKVVKEFVDENCFSGPNSRVPCEIDVLSSEFTPSGFEINGFHAGKSSNEAIRELRNIIHVFALVREPNGGSVRCQRKYTEKDTFCTKDP
jgi:hypothetical protein